MAGKEDLGGILALYSHLFKNEDYSEVTRFRSKWNEILNHDGLTYFILKEGELIVASCNVAVTPNLSRGQRAYALIENVITHPEYRRRGYGRSLISEVIEFAKRQECYKIMLLSTASEERNGAHRFYEGLGFDGNSKRGFSIRLS